MTEKTRRRSPQIPLELAAEGITEGTHKFCPDCGAWTWRAEFARSLRNSDGLTTYCKVHHNARGRQTKRKSRERADAGEAAVEETRNRAYILQQKRQQKYEASRKKAKRTCAFELCDAKLSYLTRGGYCAVHDSPDKRRESRRWFAERECRLNGQEALAV